MKILIIGSSGFLGSWVCRILSKDHEVIALVRESSNTFNINNIESIKIMRSNVNSWCKIIDNLKPDAILLLNWSGVENIARNSEAQLSNVELFNNLVDQAVESKIPKVIGFGSQAELGPVSHSISDDQEDNPTTIYGQAKIQCRINGLSKTKDSGTNFTWVRIFSVYGPLDSESWLIPSAIITLSESKPFYCTPGLQEWSFLHAYDFARAVKYLIENNPDQKIFNLGNPSTNTVKKVLSLIEELLGKNRLLKFGAISYRDDQVMKLEPKCEGLINLGWKPKVSLESGIRQSIDWFIGNTEKPLLLDENESIFFGFLSKSKKH